MLSQFTSGKLVGQRSYHVKLCLAEVKAQVEVDQQEQARLVAKNKNQATKLQSDTNVAYAKYKCGETLVGLDLRILLRFTQNKDRNPLDPPVLKQRMWLS